MHDLGEDETQDRQAASSSSVLTFLAHLSLPRCVQLLPVGRRRAKHVTFHVHIGMRRCDVEGKHASNVGNRRRVTWGLMHYVLSPYRRGSRVYRTPRMYHFDNLASRRDADINARDR